MLSLFLLLLAGEAPRALEPRPASWGELTAQVFPAEWMLPEALWRPADAARALPLALAELVAQRFDAPANAPWMASVGDLVAEHRRRGGTRADLNALLRELESSRPATHARVAAFLKQVLVADALRDPKWDPDDDRDDDGIWFGPLLERRTLADAPWNAHKGATTLHQAATLVHADLDSWLAALHDYAATLRDKGTSYERLEPRAETLLAGEDEEHGPFAALRLTIRSGLPFPFSHYDCDLGVLHRLDREKHLVTYVYSPSRDFYWLAGEDVQLPVRTAAGEWVGTLIVRLSGFDLRGVPDGDDDRKAGTRAALGNLRRRAEADFARSGGVPRTIDGALPKLRVLAPAAKK